MSVMKDENCLCPGYTANHHGSQGRCCCGLHWAGTMPMHTRTGEIVPDAVVARWYRRTLEAIETELRRRRERQAVAAARAPYFFRKSEQ